MTPEPIRRSALRLRLGGLALCWRRRLLWHTGGLRFARPRPEVVNGFTERMKIGWRSTPRPCCAGCGGRTWPSSAAR